MPLAHKIVFTKNAVEGWCQGKARDKYVLQDVSSVSQMLKLIIFGPPSAGKGTQAQMLSKKYAIPQIATGDLLREAVARKTPLGVKIKSYLDSGRLGPDDLIVQLISDRASQPDCAEGYILDGFPRTMGQAEELDKMTEIDLVLNIVVELEELVERAVGRRICPECAAVYHVRFNPPKTDGRCDKCDASLTQRDDDKEHTVRNRLRIYMEQTAPLVEHFRKKGSIVDIDGSVGIDGVFDQMVEAIERVHG